MATGKKPLIKTLAASNRLLWCGAVVVGTALCLSGLLTLPFFFESQSMFYKFGLDKILLRTGKMVGLAAAFFLLLQLPLAGRIKCLDRLFSLPGLYRLHRFNAYGLGFLALLHPVLVFVPDGTLMIPLEGRYWPEWVGATLLAVIIAQLIISRWRRLFFKAYQKWLLLHRILGMAAMGLGILHILYVSETFEHSGPPRTLILTTASLSAVLWIWIRTRPAWVWKKPYQVTTVNTAGKNAYTIELEPEGASRINYLPGQFAFLSVGTTPLLKEFHPFTLSASPGKTAGIQFTIRCCGDWTNQIGTLKNGARAAIQGPYGRFSHLFLAPRREIIFIAGGIGITPMLSMLRYMAETGDQRAVTLLWSNQTEGHLFGRSELDALTRQLTAFRWIPIFTRERSKEGQSGRLDQTLLASLLRDNGRDAAIFLCGPPQMIQQVRIDLQLIGFPRRAILSEAFGF